MSEILLNTLEDERRFVARELHDGVAQTTLQLGLQAGICIKLLERGKMEMLADELAQLESRIRLASGQVREMIADLRRPQIEPEAHVGEYIQQTIESHLERGGPPVECVGDLSHLPPCSIQQKLALYRIVQEALLNIRKHAQAQNVQIRFSNSNDKNTLIIADDGMGFDIDEVSSRPSDKGGAGLANLQVRGQIIGGVVSISPNSRGQGTEVKISF